MPDAESVPLPEMSWFGGLFDGEGCVVFNKHHTEAMPSFHLELLVGNTYGEVIQLFYQRFGGNRTVKPPNTWGRKRKFYLWRVAGPTARAGLLEMLPFLVVKKEQAEVVLDYYKLPWRGSGGQRTLREYEIDRQHYDRVAELKQLTPHYDWEEELIKRA